MPLFEYHCSKCDKIFETFVRDSNEVVSCNICQSENVEKIFSVFGVNSKTESSSAEENTGSCISSCSCCN